VSDVSLGPIVAGGYSTAAFAVPGASEPDAPLALLVAGLLDSETPLLTLPAPTRRGLISRSNSDFVPQLAAGGRHVVTYDEAGHVCAVGANDDGQLGTGDRSSRSVLACADSTPGEHPVVSVAAGFGHSFAVDSAGHLFAWGASDAGQTGLGARDEPILTPTLVTHPLLANLTDATVCAGGHYSLALRADGSLVSWGGNAFGALGRPEAAADGAHEPALLSLPDGRTARAVSCGGDHVLVLADDGSVLSFGWNEYGQCGTGGEEGVESVRTPTPVDLSALADDEQVVSVAAGGYAHSALLTSTGHVYTWGLGEFGALGHSYLKGEATPRRVLGLPTAVALAAGGYKHTVVRDDTGTIHVAGDTLFNQRSLWLPQGSLAPVHILYRDETALSPLPAWLGVGTHPNPGARKQMEDSVVIGQRGGDGLWFIGVYDGHGGRRVVELVRDTLAVEVLRRVPADLASDAVGPALRDAYAAVQHTIRRASGGHATGACALTALYDEGRGLLRVANAGDCEAYLADGETLTVAHRAHMPEERARVEAAGGFVRHGRVQGSLQIARAFGDLRYTDFGVHADPDVSRLVTSFPSDTVVFGSDGLFDYTELETILSDATVSTSSAADVAAAMARNSVTRDNSRDNVAVVVLRTGKAAAGEEGRTEL
jgi:alpha-tubulin suppressor-like RCC1 family protein/serine/threonine protein phosphatase PrpC